MRDSHAVKRISRRKRDKKTGQSALLMGKENRDLNCNRRGKARRRGGERGRGREREGEEEGEGKKKTGEGDRRRG